MAVATDLETSGYVSKGYAQAISYCMSYMVMYGLKYEKGFPSAWSRICCHLPR